MPPKVKLEVQKSSEGPEYNSATGRTELKVQCPEKRDTLSKKLYFFPGCVAAHVSHTSKAMITVGAHGCRF